MKSIKYIESQIRENLADVKVLELSLSLHRRFGNLNNNSSIDNDIVKEEEKKLLDLYELVIWLYAHVKHVTPKSLTKFKSQKAVIENIKGLYPVENYWHRIK